ncbi:DUF257 family protein [Thermococcus thioreducens]|uniref:Uncharacterized protein n=1 Tax=Thermococcus thioreducens TaxID=277988 RepID=A0A0Q2S3S7_9EURY|nr:DUF257 family protein [Thermococcus thioreducens]ASJ11803.1 hypothetical protein A3L14_02370 [Thermococcus thioreducens]KQH82139.1 hypothetical protein AMR53_07310 [Thermococcus thioreducens]SEW13504.1 protein of unknown function, DUF257 [Thermococcus thioreducens]
MDSIDELLKAIDAVKPGETVLVEYYPSYVPEFATLTLLMYARKKGVPVVIDDNFDALHVIQKHLALWGIHEDFSDVLVIKSDGHVDVGNIVSRINFSDSPDIYVKKYEDVGKKIVSSVGESINIVLGFEKIFAFVHTIREFYLVMTRIQKFLGNPRRAFYLVNKKTAEGLEFNPLPEMERIASTVVEIFPTPASGRIIFKKSPIFELIGRELEIPIGVIVNAAGGKGDHV